MGCFLVRDRLAPLDLGPRRGQLRLEQDSVRLVDLSRSQRLARRTQLAARYDDGGPRPPGNANLGDARGCKGGEVSRLQTCARFDDGLAGADVSSCRANIRSPLDGVLDLNRVVTIDNVLEGDDGIGSLGHHSTCGYAHRLSGFERTRRRRARGDPVNDRQPSRRVARAQRETVHRRAVERRQVDCRDRVIGEHSPEGCLDAAALLRQGRARSSTSRSASPIEIRFRVAAKQP
jgi:hypothetical protein